MREPVSASDSSVTAPRFDIQFMRGVAVLAVVVFHAFPGTVPQGFLGVDVFFVVSGFLITGIILKGVGKPGFFVNFYKRRALRLLPASLTTLAVTTALAFVFLTSSQMSDYAAQLLGALAFVSNFVLAMQTGYFEAAAETKPLLHIWSLSLEEQFYFLAPLLLWLTPLRARPWLLLTGLVLSLALCVMLVTGVSWLPVPSTTAANFAFFMLPTRAWELLAGSLCAWLMINRPGLTIPVWVKYLALAAIPLVCVISFDQAHPRWEAVIAVLATSLLLLGKDDWLPNVGLTRPVWHVGNWSYSLYLIHWPLFSFAYIAYGERPPWQVLIGLALLSLVLARYQWKYIEQTCRDGLPFKLNAPAVLGSLMVSLAVIAAPSMGATSPTAAQLKPVHGLGPECGAPGAAWVDEPTCRTAEQPTIAVWGDSYAMHLIPGLAGVPLVQLTKSACAPVQGVANIATGYPPSWAAECVAFNESALRAIEGMPSVRFVVISSPFYQVLYDDGQQLFLDGRAQPFSVAGKQGLERALVRLKAAGKTPILVGPTPGASFDAGRCNERAIEGRPMFGRTQCDVVEGEGGTAHINAALLAVGRNTGTDVYLPARALCQEGLCRTRHGDVIIYQDSGHLTDSGSRFVMEQLGIVRRLTDVAL
jgi:peptidoglycan/LPS O-acetylase OafA/YrhL